MHRLGYGQGWIEFTDDYFDVIDVISPKTLMPVDKQKIIEALENPTHLPPLQEYFKNTKKVLIVVSDITRYTGVEKYLHEIISRLDTEDIEIVFATGLHRAHTMFEQMQIVGEEVFSKMKCFDHNPTLNTVNIGKTPKGITIEINRAVVEADGIILTGAVGFHYLAGISGGLKSLFLGLCSQKTILDLHKITMQKDSLDWAKAGHIINNLFYQEIVSSANLINKKLFLTNPVLTMDKEIAEMFCGDPLLAHQRAHKFLIEHFSTKIYQKADIVIASCGGYPRDINFIQTHKSIQYASEALKDSGVMIMLAECRDGFGYKGFIDWFRFKDPEKLYLALSKNFHTYGRTAWALMQKARRFKIILVSNLPQQEVTKTGLIYAKDLDEALKIAKTMLPHNPTCYVIPAAGSVIPII
jgi:nickel-dependent lactate racemase